jgi:hypothetical protein
MFTVLNISNYFIGKPFNIYILIALSIAAYSAVFYYFKDSILSNITLISSLIIIFIIDLVSIFIIFNDNSSSNNKINNELFKNIKKPTNNFDIKLNDKNKKSSNKNDKSNNKPNNKSDDKQNNKLDDKQNNKSDDKQNNKLDDKQNNKPVDKPIINNDLNKNMKPDGNIINKNIDNDKIQADKNKLSDVASYFNKIPLYDGSVNAQLETYE